MADEKLISKKDLLLKYGISYGALYRWKRMGLIPEDWFLRRATSTGQETFFPEALICERVELIQNGKNEFELQTLANKLRGRAEEEWTLTLSTEYGEKTFRFSDIKRICLSKGNLIIDVTECVSAQKKEQ